MNKKFIITSTAWQGEVELMYSDETLAEKDGNMLLVFLDIRRAELSEQQHIWFLRSMPRELAGLEDKLRGSSATLTEVQIEVTFDLFWKAYQPGRNDNHRARAEKVWNKLSREEQVKAFNYIDKYDRNRPDWQNKLFASSYLKDRCWE